MKKIVCLIIAVSQLLSANEFTCGELVFPAKRNINFEKGTFEVWYKTVIPDDETYELGASSSRSVCSFMYVKNEPYTDKNEERFFNYGLNLGRNDKINLTVSLYKLNFSHF